MLDGRDSLAGEAAWRGGDERSASVRPGACFGAMEAPRGRVRLAVVSLGAMLEALEERFGRSE
jgi:hypothetical protein